MTRGADEDKNDVPVPRETTVLFGHDSAERAFLAVYRSGRVPHAWLIGGEPGIGKATLAYRIARFVLAEPDPSRASTAETLALDPAHRTVRRVAVNAHPDLLALERTPGESGTMRTAITVERVRRLATFFGSTPGGGGWDCGKKWGRFSACWRRPMRVPSMPSAASSAASAASSMSLSARSATGSRGGSARRPATSRGLRARPTCGSASTGRRGTWRSTISNASPSFLRSSVFLPRRPAVDTYPALWSGFRSG